LRTVLGFALLMFLTAAGDVFFGGALSEGDAVADAEAEAGGGVAVDTVFVFLVAAADVVDVVTF
jgi:hypothetical protein